MSLDLRTFLISFLVALSIAPSFPPTNVNCHNASSTSLAILWETPSTKGMNNSFIRGYKVRVRPRGNNSEEWKDILVCNSSLNTTKKELKTFTEYEIQVAALNGAGRSNFSERIFCFTDADGECR